MRVPVDVQEKVAELGAQVLEDDATEADVGEQGALWLNRQSPVFAMNLLAEWWRRRTRSWIYAQTRRALRDGEEDDGQLTLPFDDLPPFLEVAIGVKKHQSVMTRRDWENTVAIYRNRRQQADVLLRAVERAADEVIPLLDLTTADVLDGAGAPA